MAEVIVRPAAPKVNEEFGTSVAGSSNTIIVGASAGGAGRAYVFIWNGSAWVEQAQLQSTTPNVYEFGEAVALDGDCAVVGAPSGGVQGSGQVYVYRRTGTSWVEEATLTASGTPGYNQFGRSVSLDGDQLIVGGLGSATVFRRTGTAWSEEASLMPPATSLGNAFGCSVGLHGEHAVVGDEWSGGAAASQGSACVFRRTGTAWNLMLPVLTAPDPTLNDHFGASVAIRDDRVLVGAPGVTGGGVAEAGGAYVFVRSGAAWGMEAKLEPLSQGVHGVHAFGEAVSLAGDYALVGNPSDHTPDPGSGSAYLFKRAGSQWILVPPVLRASNAYWFAWFGRAVSVSDAGVFVGAPEAQAPDYDNGLLYYYALPADIRDLLRADRDWSRYADILFGVIAGGGGVVIKPGSGPTPVDPEPFRVWKDLAASKRQLVLGQALEKIAALIDDQKASARVVEVAKRLNKAAAEQKG